MPGDECCALYSGEGWTGDRVDFCLESGAAESIFDFDDDVNFP